MWLQVAIELGLQLLGFGFSFFKDKKESKKWLAEVSTELRKRRLVRQEFVVRMDQDSQEYIDQKIKESEATNGNTETR